MAEKDNQQAQEKKESLLFSLFSKKKSGSEAETEGQTSENQSLLYTLWKNVSGGFNKNADSEETEPEDELEEQQALSEQQEQVEEPEKEELFEEGNALLELARAWMQEKNAALGDQPKLEKWGPKELAPDEELLPVHRDLIKQATVAAEKMLLDFKEYYFGVILTDAM